MAIYPKNEKEYAGQSLNDKWADLAENESFKQAVEKIPSSIPSGGGIGQILVKKSVNNYDTEWADPSGGGLEGTNYVFVAANGTDTENAAELQAAYNTAKTMSPSATNRITIVAANGYYNFGSSAFIMDTQYIDLVSLDGNRSIIFNSANTAGTISITANDVFVKGVDVGTKGFTIADNLNLLKVENCRGGIYSFGGLSDASGTFKNCVGGVLSFGRNNSSASGTFENCIGGNFSFGGNNSTASGLFINCTAGGNSFGGSNGIASGSFINCTALSNSFAGSNGNASGTFKNCVGGNSCFGSSTNGTSFASGTFINCVGGNTSFGYQGTASGTFENCIGGGGSFGFDPGTGSGTLTGKLYYCRLTSGTFQTVSGAGITRLCIDGNNNENNQG